jgi:hypothetical protein
VDLLLGALSGVTRIADGPSADLLESQAEAAATLPALPAFAGQPWITTHADELRDIVTLRQPAPVPFQMWQTPDYTGTTINVEDGERRSYRPPTRGEPLVVQLYGGSTMFGFGQRDEHTIASELARIGAEHGVNLEVHNVSSTGWVLWQEMLAFEDRLATEPAPHLAIFYDGVNDLDAQQEHLSDRPTLRGRVQLESLLERAYDESYRAPGFLDGARDVWEAYRDASFTGRLWHELFAPEPSQPEVASPEEAVDATLAAYERGVAMVHDLADRHDVEVEMFWQPIEVGWPVGLLERLPAGVHDISGAFEGVPPEDVYFDGTHTNELGARLVAEAMWAEVDETLASSPTG